MLGDHTLGTALNFPGLFPPGLREMWVLPTPMPCPGAYGMAKYTSPSYFGCSLEHALKILLGL